MAASSPDIDAIWPTPPAGLDPHALDLKRIPTSLAVIMDGNGRWARSRKLARLRGHSAGINAVRETIRTCSDVGIRYLTIYSFSTENWKRPASEVDGLMDLFAKTMLAELDGLDREGVRVMTIGDAARLPRATRDAFAEAEAQTRENDGLTLVVAVNYGSRAEIVAAVRRWLTEIGDEQAVRAAEEVSEETIASHLDTAALPDPDLVIRTSGELRLSNFLLWQCAYAEFIVSPVLWPDFDRYELLRCLLEYQGRTRRFGAVV